VNREFFDASERPSILQTVAITLLLAGTECTVLLDRSSVQCETDADCERFGGHPYCRSSVCVRSYLQPKDCVLATPARPPSTRAEFLEPVQRELLARSHGNHLPVVRHLRSGSGRVRKRERWGIMGPSGSGARDGRRHVEPSGCGAVARRRAPEL